MSNYVERALGTAYDDLGMAYGGLYYRTRGEGFYTGIGADAEITLSVEDLRKAEKAMIAVEAAKKAINDAAILLADTDLKFS